MTNLDTVRQHVVIRLQGAKTSTLIMMLSNRAVADEVLGPALDDLHPYQRVGMLCWAADAALEEIDRQDSDPGSGVVSEQLHIGFTGTRRGMTPEQQLCVMRLLVESTRGIERYVAHHGLCIGGDEQFHDICRASPRSHIVGHPGPDWPHGELCARVECDEVLDPMPYMKRNQAIVNASKIVIAAPLQDDPIVSALGSGRKAKVWGGTWRTIGMARRALRAGLLRELHVVGRTGDLLDHTRWPL